MRSGQRYVPCFDAELDFGLNYQQRISEPTFEGGSGATDQRSDPKDGGE
jgi:hypothetical protein